MNKKQITCPIEATLQIIGGKYKALILWQLSIHKTLRFGELNKLVLATPKMLTQQLRELEADGLIKRKVYPIVPPKVEYSLSKFGTSIFPILDAMCEWGQGFLGDS